MVFSENTKTEIQIRKFKAKTILLFFIVITITVGVVSFVITRKSSNAMQNKVVNLVAQGNRQQINNVNSYLGKIEDMAALLFSDELYYEFDATDPALDTFEKLQTEKTIKDRLDDLGILENFSDFGIVYADDSTIGWISNTTIQLFPNGGLFAYLDSNINNSKTGSGWLFDYSKCYDRLYYLKRLNKNAILIAAFYSRELSDALTASDDMSELQPEMFWMKKVSLLVMRSLLMIRENRIQIGWKFCRRYLRRKISTIPLKRMLTIICMVKSPKKKLWMQS